MPDEQWMAAGPASGFGNWIVIDSLDPNGTPFPRSMSGSYQPFAMTGFDVPSRDVGNQPCLELVVVVDRAPMIFAVSSPLYE